MGKTKYNTEEEKKEAIKNSQKKYKENNKEKRIEYEKDNREKINAKAREYRSRNKERDKQKNEDYRKKHNEEILKRNPNFHKERGRKFRENSPLKAMTASANSLAKSRNPNISDRLTSDEIEDLYYNKQKKMCAVLKVEMPPGLLSIDHIIPISKGGSNKIENVQLVYYRYNYFKNDMDEETARKEWEAI